jgi:hypothetical protein
VLQDLTLTTEQYDICWADLGLGEHVYPLQVRSHGRTHEERAELRRRVYQQLTARGLARGEWLGPELRDVLTLLARAPVWLDMHWLSAPGQAELDRVVAARSGEQGLLARLDAVGLRLMPCRGTSLLITLVGQLPTTAAARGQSISLPREVLVSAGPAVGGSVYDRPAGTSSRFRLQFLALETVLAKPRVRGGQIVANARDGTGRRRRSRPVEWFDTEAGRWTARVLPTTDGSEHLTVTPADGALLATQLREMLDSILR